MNKNNLVRFINKYNLNGNVNSVVLNSKDNTLSTRFITGDKSLLGELSLSKWKFEEKISPFKIDVIIVNHQKYQKNRSFS